MALCQSINELFQSKKELLDAKNVVQFKFLKVWDYPFTLKNFMHPSCQVLGATPDINFEIHGKADEKYFPKKLFMIFFKQEICPLSKFTTKICSMENHDLIQNCSFLYCKNI